MSSLPSSVLGVDSPRRVGDSSQPTPQVCTEQKSRVPICVQMVLKLLHRLCQEVLDCLQIQVARLAVNLQFDAVPQVAENSVRDFHDDSPLDLRYAPPDFTRASMRAANSSRETAISRESGSIVAYMYDHAEGQSCYEAPVHAGQIGAKSLPRVSTISAERYHRSENVRETIEKHLNSA
jgi:hypothetical protein